MDIKLLIRRFIAFAIDWNVMLGGAMALLFYGPGTNPEYIIAPSMKMFATPGFFLGGIWFVVFCLFKDCLFGKRSLGKLILGLKIVDADTLGKPSLGKLILRNLTFMIAQVKGLVVLLNQGRRLGDVIAKTKVVSRK